MYHEIFTKMLICLLFDLFQIKGMQAKITSWLVQVFSAMNVLP